MSIPSMLGYHIQVFLLHIFIVLLIVNDPLWDKIVVRAVVKANISELEEEVGERFSRRTRKEFTDVVQGIYGKKSLLERFQYR